MTLKIKSKRQLAAWAVEFKGPKLKARREFISAIGNKFGGLYIKGILDKPGESFFVAQCDCGKEVVKHARELLKGRHVRCGYSCKSYDKGLITSKANVNRGRNPRKFWHSGLVKLGKTTMTYKEFNRGINVLFGMKQRCDTSPFYKNITVYKKWLEKPWKFVLYMGAKPNPRASIDRIDGNKGYYPGNVRWASPKVQAQNKDMVRDRRKIYCSLIGRYSSKGCKLIALIITDGAITGATMRCGKCNKVMYKRWTSKRLIMSTKSCGCSSGHSSASSMRELFDRLNLTPKKVERVSRKRGRLQTVTI